MKDIIKRLHAERKRIDKAIAALESIQAAPARPKRGRPRKAKAATDQAEPIPAKPRAPRKDKGTKVAKPAESAWQQYKSAKEGSPTPSANELSPL